MAIQSRWIGWLLVAWLWMPLSSSAAVSHDQMVFMLEHMAEDYPETVRAGRILDQPEYAELRAFARAVEDGVSTLPPGNEGGRLAEQASALREAISARAASDTVVPLIRSVRQGLESAYGAGESRTATDTSLPAEGALDVAARLIGDSRTAYARGERAKAVRLALDACLDGFELVEKGLAARAPELKERIEAAMVDYRELMREGVPATEVEAAADSLDGLLARAREVSGEARMSPGLSFTTSFLVLLREGVEAIIVLAAIGAILVRAGRRDALRFVHGGWILALFAGLATWTVASYVIEISGASREISEGAAALLAAGVLFYVGFWLHDKSHARRWQDFVRQKLDHALQGGGLWLLGGVAFIAVYREAFETVLFYQALWLQSAGPGHAMMIGGFAAAAAALVALAWLIVRYSMRLPLKAFFRGNAFLMYALAVIFAGKGVAALQEAGTLPVHSIGFPKVHVLGVYPNLESLGLQVLLLLIAAASWWRLRIRDTHMRTPHSAD